MMNLAERRFHLAGSFSRSGGVVMCGLMLVAWQSLAGAQESANPKARVAAVPPTEGATGARKVLDNPRGARPAVAQETDPIVRARQMIAESRVRFQSVHDYSCTFFKRERIDGKLSDSHVMIMKARSKPTSLYFKFIQPNAGREAIWIEGKNGNKVIAHEAGLNKVLAGTMHLDPKGGMAMEDNRHPISEAGIGSLIETVIQRWNTELIPGVTVVVFHPQAKVGDRACMMVETIHDASKETCAFGRVRLYFDKENGLPIRFEGYAWPKRPGLEGELLEEYTYFNLKVNPGLKDRDFDPRNSGYSYGRF